MHMPRDEWGCSQAGPGKVIVSKSSAASAICCCAIASALVPIRPLSNLTVKGRYHSITDACMPPARQSFVDWARREAARGSLSVETFVTRSSSLGGTSTSGSDGGEHLFHLGMKLEG